MTAKSPNGYTLWAGPSPVDRAPIACVATGLIHQSENPKTGPMVQVYVFRTDVPPHVAIQTGEDQSVCNGCPLRPILVRQKAREEGIPRWAKPTMCYVTPHFGLRSVWDGYNRGIFPRLHHTKIDTVMGNRPLRMGSYGNFSNVPAWLVRKLAKVSNRQWTLYEHDWATLDNQWLQPFAMASVSSEAEKAQAQELGWRTFRVKRPNEPTHPDEVKCPASEEGGRVTTCHKCLLCQGTSKEAKSVVINDHGPTSPEFIAKVVALRHQKRKELVTV